MIGKTATCSELRNAEELIEAHGEEIRYAPGIGWLWWDSQRWATDDSAVVRLCIETLRDLYEPAYQELAAALDLLEHAADKDEEKEAKKLVAKAKVYPSWLANSMSEKGIEHMMGVASHDGRVRILATMLDANPEQLNVQNGTVNLRTGILHEHNRGDLITRISPIVYSQEVDQTAWLTFLASATLNDADMIEELRILVGITYLGGPNEQNAIVLVSGPPGSGKGTFVDAVKRALGKDYCRIVPFDIFLRSKNKQELRPDVLFGRRMVVAAEADEESKIDEGKISNMSGGDELNVRALYEKSFDFLPEFIPWLQTNAPPKMNLDGVSNGLSRRLLTPHFQHVIPEEHRDPEIKKFWTDPLRGGIAVMAWAVSGAVSYLETRKLYASVASKARKEKLRADNDPIAGFVTQYLVLAPEELRKGHAAEADKRDFREACHQEEYWIRKIKVRERYELWCKEEGNKSPLSQQKFRACIESPAYGCHYFYHHGAKCDVLFGARELRLTDDVTDRAAAQAPANDQEYAAQ